jgi:hypothetical protein
VSGPDVAIAGTGVLGMVIALAAADAGLQVALVWPGYDTCGAASPAAGAMLGVLGEHTAAEQGPQGRADLAFRHESALRWPQWVDEIAEHSGATVPVHHGTVVIANLDNSGDRDNLERFATRPTSSVFPPAIWILGKCRATGTPSRAGSRPVLPTRRLGRRRCPASRLGHRLPRPPTNSSRAQSRPQRLGLRRKPSGHRPDPRRQHQSDGHPYRPGRRSSHSRIGGSARPGPRTAAYGYPPRASA